MNSCPCATLSRPCCLHGFIFDFSTPATFLAFKTYYCHILCINPCLLCCTRHCAWLSYSPTTPRYWQTLWRICIYLQPRIIMLWLRVILVRFSCLICSMFISHTGSLFVGPFHVWSVDKLHAEEPHFIWISVWVSEGKINPYGIKYSGG